MNKQDLNRLGMDQGNGGTDTSSRSGVIDAAKDKIQELASQARESAGEQAESRFSSGKARATNALGSIAQSLHSTGEELRGKEQGAIGDYAEQAAGKVEELSQYLENATLGDITTRVEEFARREPALFVGGVFALGFIGARFLKSSQRNLRGSSPATRSRASSARAFGAQLDGQAGAPWSDTGEREVKTTAQREWSNGSAAGGRSEDDSMGLA